MIKDPITSLVLVNHLHSPPNIFPSGHLKWFWFQFYFWSKAWHSFYIAPLQSLVGFDFQSILDMLHCSTKLDFRPPFFRHHVLSSPYPLEGGRNDQILISLVRARAESMFAINFLVKTTVSWNEQWLLILAKVGNMILVGIRLVLPMPRSLAVPMPMSLDHPGRAYANKIEQSWSCVIGQSSSCQQACRAYVTELW